MAIKPSTTRYAKKAEIVRTLLAIRSTGMVLGSVEIAPDGTIRVSSDANPNQQADNDFDRWEASGLL